VAFLGDGYGVADATKSLHPNHFHFLFAEDSIASYPRMWNRS
jgi:hypothetical protein